MNLQEALKETGVAEAEFDTYTVGVREDENETGPTLYVWVAVGGMPPHFSKEVKTLEEVQAEIMNSFLPAGLDWSPVEPEQ